QRRRGGRIARAASSRISAPVYAAARLRSAGVGLRRNARTVTRPPARSPVANHHNRSSMRGRVADSLPVPLSAYRRLQLREPLRPGLLRSLPAGAIQGERLLALRPVALV